jgi:hypothetical protein
MANLYVAAPHSGKRASRFPTALLALGHRDRDMKPRPIAGATLGVLAIVWGLLLVTDTRVLISETKVDPGQTFVVAEWGDLGKAGQSQLYCKYTNGRRPVGRVLWYSPNNVMGADACPFLLPGSD